ncbi:VIT family protein [Agromyces tropicus]|uniref:VIT family protein n=2 Tax=Agromyces tropicus TaxID=555371 RepID=A0ABP5GHZ7_9MICO
MLAGPAVACETADMTDATAEPVHRTDPHDGKVHEKLNWLRAAVLGANDGIISVAALVVGVAAATTDLGAILVAGVASVLAGAISMGLGEYVSVSSQRDTEHALIAKEQAELATMPEQELAELAAIYRGKGLSPETAETVAKELTEHDALAAHLEAELHISETDVVNPWHAAWASAASFLVGAILPMLAILLPPPEWRIATTFVAVIVALAITGWLSAWIGGAPRTRAVGRVVIGGALALAVTWVIGGLLGGAL